MPHAAGLHHIRWRKKKVDGFIIPAKYYYGRVKELEVEAPEVLTVPTQISQIAPATPSVAQQTVQATVSQPTQAAPESVPDTSKPTVTQEIPVQSGTAAEAGVVKFPALSLSSIKAKKQLEQAGLAQVQHSEKLPTEAFTETEMLLQWNKYAQRLGDKGQKIMESLLLINDPKLEGTRIVHELPNEGSKIEFESEKNELQGYLRGKLHNHDIVIDVTVNENVENKFAFTTQDKFNRLNQINPTLEVLKKTFDLDI